MVDDEEVSLAHLGPIPHERTLIEVGALVPQTAVAFGAHLIPEGSDRLKRQI